MQRNAYVYNTHRINLEHITEFSYVWARETVKWTEARLPKLQRTILSVSYIWPRELRFLASFGGQLRDPLKKPRTSQQYGFEMFKGPLMGPLMGPLLYRELSDDRCQYCQTRREIFFESCWSKPNLNCNSINNKLSLLEK